MALELIIATALALSVQQSGGDDGNKAATDDTAQAAAAKEEAADEDMNQIKCRYIYQVNSRVPDRICRTKARWAEIKKEQQEALESGRRAGGNASETGTIYGADPIG